MKKLLKKMHKQVEVAEPTDNHNKFSAEQLEHVFDDHSIDRERYDGFFQDLMEWKKSL